MWSVRLPLAMKGKLAIAGAVSLLCVTVLGVAVVMGGGRFNSKARREWKEEAVAELAQFTSHSARVRKEIESLKTKPSGKSEWDKWISDDIVLMRNGEWMAYRNTCAKGYEISS